MSRSRKKNPAGGNTTAASDKVAKRRANKAFRKAPEAMSVREVSDFWSFPKDGKKWYGYDDPKLRRK